MLIDYVTLETDANQAGEVAADLARTRPGDGEARRAGIFTPLIGGSVNRIRVLLRGPDEAAMTQGRTRLTEGGARLHDHLRLEPVQERALGLLAPVDAMFTNRWFHVSEGGAEEFETDTQAAWSGFEGDTDSGVVGLWKAAPRDGVVSYLLIARYADLAAWNASRYWNRKTADADDADWIERFERRRRQMVDSSVIATICAGADGEASA